MFHMAAMAAKKVTLPQLAEAFLTIARLDVVLVEQLIIRLIVEDGTRIKSIIFLEPSEHEPHLNLVVFGMQALNVRRSIEEIQKASAEENAALIKNERMKWLDRLQALEIVENQGNYQGNKQAVLLFKTLLQLHHIFKVILAQIDYPQDKSGLAKFQILEKLYQSLLEQLEPFKNVFLEIGQQEAEQHRTAILMREKTIAQHRAELLQHTQLKIEFGWHAVEIARHQQGIKQQQAEIERHKAEIERCEKNDLSSKFFTEIAKHLQKMQQEYRNLPEAVGCFEARKVGKLRPIVQVFKEAIDEAIRTEQDLDDLLNRSFKALEFTAKVSPRRSSALSPSSSFSGG